MTKGVAWFILPLQNRHMIQIVRKECIRFFPMGLVIRYHVHVITFYATR